MTTDRFQPQRMRHPIRMRMLQVKRVADLSPTMRRITLEGDDLEGFLSASFDDHVKLLMPHAAGEQPQLPTVGPNGLVFDPDQPRPEMRDYTPRRYDAASGELDVDFVLGHPGPATEWATAAEPGHWLGIAGPRGSMVIPMAFDWYLLVGDESGLPAIARRLEELPESATAIVVVKTQAEDGRIALRAGCRLQEHWVVEAGGGAAGPGVLEATVRGLQLPEGEGHAWAAGEYSDIKAVRRHLVEERGMDKSRVRAASYWRKAAANSHEHFD